MTMRRVLLALLLTVAIAGAAAAQMLVVRSSVSAGGYTQWRVLFPVLSSTYGLGELEFHATAGGANIATGGTPSASTTASGSAANLFDGNTATIWEASNGTDQWVAYNFGSKKTVAEIKLCARNDSSYAQAPLWVHVQGYDGASWVTAWTVIPAAWTQGACQSFAKPASLAALAANVSGYRHLEIEVAYSSVGNTVTSAQAITLAETSGGTNYAPGTLPTISQTIASHYPWYAIDGVSTTDSATDAAYPQYFRFDTLFGNRAGLDEVKITSRNDSNFAQAPVHITVKGSPDGSSFTPLWRSSYIVWSQNETHTFTKPSYAGSMTGGHRYWRLRSTAGAAGISSTKEVRAFIAGGVDVTAWATISVGSGGSQCQNVIYTMDGGASANIFCSTSLPSDIVWDFGSGFAPDIRRVDWTTRSDCCHTQAPSGGQLDWSDDNSSWTSASTFTGLSWSSGETKSVINY